MLTVTAIFTLIYFVQQSKLMGISKLSVDIKEELLFQSVCRQAMTQRSPDKLQAKRDEEELT